MTTKGQALEALDAFNICVDANIKCRLVRRLIKGMHEDALEAMAGDGWRPIETAPRDGSYILLYRLIGDHRQRRAVQEGKFHRYGMKDTWRVMSGGVWDIDAPTHWMPLPQPPKGQDDDN